MKIRLFTLFLAFAVNVGTIFADKVKIENLYYNLDANDKTAEVAYGNYSGNIIIPSSVEYDSVTYTVTTIGNRAFSDCNYLTSISIPNSITSIEENAFLRCSGLMGVHISDLNAWCAITFGNKSSSPFPFVQHLYLNDIEITELTIPNSITSIGASTFYGCSVLTSVTIPNSVTSIGNAAFAWCTGLINVIISNSVTSIGDEAFEGCSGLTSVTIPNSVTNIGNAAFSNCSGLTSITIPNSVTSIGGGTFQNCFSLTSVTFPNSITSIADWVFADCTSLMSVTIPNSITSIGDYAFRGCSLLTTVTIPSYVMSIGDWAFAYSGLKSITCEVATPPTCGDNTFSFMSKSIPLYVPANSVIDYKVANIWKDFTQILPIASESAPAVYTNPVNSAQKLIRNGNVYILSGDKTYTITGQHTK